jgi:tetratricopeptide (TPR) repeat protein
MALVYQKEGRLDDAIALFERGRKNLPARWAAYTVNIAVLQRIAGRPEEAGATLRSLGDRLTTSNDPAVLRAHWFLGELEREAGRAGSAIASYQAYLSATARIDDPAVARLRESATARIHELAGAPKAP